MSKTIKVYEIFSSIMGEYNEYGQGIKATFVRLSGCNLKCSYCDTSITQDYSIGTEYSINALVKEINRLENRVVCITGGEPLLQNHITELISKLYDIHDIVLETNGTISIDKVFDMCNTIMDWKLENEELMYHDNLRLLSHNDAIKFVISSEHEFYRAYELTKLLETNALFVFSPNLNKISANELFSLFNKTKFNKEVLFSLQIHKVIGCR